MKAWPLHVVFAGLLAGSLTANGRAGDVLVRHDNLQPAITRVARAHGLRLLDDITLTGTPIRALEFEAPGCAGPVMVAVLTVIIDLEPVLHHAREQGDMLRYVYIERSWDKPDRLAVFIERMKYTALSMLGLSRYVPSQDLLLVESPSGCAAADAVDWRDVWERDDAKATPVTTR